jgi:hypothetical protein
MDRRWFLTGAAALLAGIGRASQSVTAQGLTTNVGQPELITPQTEKAIRRGLDFLAARQSERGDFGTNGYRRDVAVVSLAGMAFMANGSVPGRGRYGRQIDRCIDFVLRRAQSSGYVVTQGNVSRGPMYGHGFATLFLAEVYGMSSHAQLREKLALAVKLILNTQNQEGGWRYQPQRNDADISVTICQVMALRAARNAGLFVPNEVIDRCIDYVKRCQNPDGGFSYQLPNDESKFPRTAAGIVALNSAGIYEGDEIHKALDYLMKQLPGNKNVPVENHFFYGHYYAVQAMWHAGGEYWRRWYPAIRDVLLARQRSDGAWFDQICPEYGTAMACLILQMPNNFLPIFQR